MANTLPRLPVRLGRDVILDAIFEVRFEASEGALDILPGLLIDLYGDGAVVERLPLADVPQSVRIRDPQLSVQPTLRLKWMDTVVLIGDKNVLVGCVNPYPGWKVFRQKILLLIERIGKRMSIDSVSRYSLKYVDFLPKDEFPVGPDLYNLNLSIAGRDWDGSPIRIHSEIKEQGYATIFEFGHPVVVSVEGGAGRSGSMVSVDTICVLDSVRWDAFVELLSDQIEKVHTYNKTVFFSFMTDSALNLLEAEYDTGDSN